MLQLAQRAEGIDVGGVIADIEEPCVEQMLRYPLPIDYGRLLGSAEQRSLTATYPCVA